ncbi:MAG: twin transmembrane helix small protein [Legionellales bacterium]|nr:twin transmembrane helix small protein [Legionellales bacterium]
MLAKALIIIAMLVILISLGSSLVFLVKDAGKTTRTVKALSWRVGISLALFSFLFIAVSFGWIKPHAL